MKTIHEKLTDVELEISNLMTYIICEIHCSLNQCMEQLQVKIAEHRELQKELYIKDGIEKANIYANFEG